MSTYNDLTQVKILPISSVYYQNTAEGLDVQFDYLGEESSMLIEAIYRPNDFGGATLCGTRMTVTAYILPNNYEYMQPDLSKILTIPLERVTVELKALTGQPNGQQAAVNIAAANIDSAFVYNQITSYKIEQAKKFPRLVITSVSTCGLGAVDATTGTFFHQIVSWLPAPI